MRTMRAIRAHTRGGPEQLRWETAPVPEPAAGEVLVAVHAAAITYDELTWDQSRMRDGVDRTPVIPSHEVSGTVAEVGPKVSWPTVGEDVFALTPFERDGAAAQYVVVPAGELAAKPATATHAEAAAVPLSGLTAWQALVDHTQVTPGQSVLIVGGAGGVGAYAVQIAAHLGARVTATVRTDADVAYASTLGADRVVVGVPPQEDFDLVIDAVGAPVLAGAYLAVRPGGQLITLTAPPDPELRRGRDVHDSFFVVHPDRDQLGRLAALVDAGVLRPQVGEVRPLADAAAAYAERGRNAGPGKTVLRVD